MHKFYSPQKQISVDTIIIEEPEQVHHIKDVLCLKQAEEVGVFDESSNTYKCVVADLLKDKVILKIVARGLGGNNAGTKISVACAIPKNSRMDDIVNKLTQLGVERIIPLITERVVVKLDSRKMELRNKRWEKIALSASCQSQRNSLVILEPICDFSAVISSSKGYDLKIIPTLCAERKPLKDILLGLRPKNALILIGPEGDFSDSEIALAVKAGFLPVSLGGPVLRVETAAVAAAGFLQLFYAEH
ncbi:MAG: RsmE family RNA methyltransferase [Candidatus Omnitrophota bacterium]